MVKLIPEMTRAASPSFLGTEFDAFLFASIGEDRNGMRLSVLSALARLELDPWREAAQFVKLPTEAATRRLASLISQLPDGVPRQSDLGLVAARLIALLPHRVPVSIAVPTTRPRIGRIFNLRTVLCVLIAILLLALIVRWVSGSQQREIQVGSIRSPESSVAVPNVKSPNSGHW